MKAIEKLNVTADEFFKEITDSIIGDIKRQQTRVFMRVKLSLD